MQSWKIGRGDVDRLSTVAAAIASEIIGSALGHLGDALLVLDASSLLHFLVFDRAVDRAVDRVVDRVPFVIEVLALPMRIT